MLCHVSKNSIFKARFKTVDPILHITIMFRCDKPFLNLESHLQKAHNVKTQSEHVCSVCFKVFSKKDHLQRY